MKVSVRVDGLADLDAALGELPKATAKNVLKRVGMARLQPMAQEARRLAPDDPATQGRDLKASIAVSTKIGKYARKMSGKKDSTVEVHMGPAGPKGGHAPPQGSLQEFGTHNNAPQPFMRPAWEAGKDALLDGIKSDLGAEITRAATRLARKQARLLTKG